MRLAVALLVLVGCKREIDWSTKSAWRECAGAIDAWHEGDATPPCSALHMCANEARLSSPQVDKLGRMIAVALECRPL